MNDRPQDDPRYQRAAQALRRHEASLLAKPNVLGAGVGVDPDGEHVVVVMVRRKVALDVLSPDERLPAEIDGVPVDVRQLGEINAL
jgi:hypothetical protein